MSDRKQLIYGAIIAFVTAMLVLFVEYQTGLFAGERRSIVYQIVANTPLITTDDNVDGLQIIYNDSIVDNPRNVIIKLENNGRADIEAEDFDRGHPITLKAASAKLLSYTIETNPPNLAGNGEIKVTETNSSTVEMAIDPLLFNSGESIVFNIIIDGDLNLSIDSRISGIRQIKEKVPFEESRSFFLISGLSVFLMLLAVVVISLENISFLTRRNVVYTILFVMFLLLVYSIIAANST